MYEALEAKYPSNCHKLVAFSAAFEMLKGYAGDLAEFGCYNGNGTRELASLDPTRTVYAFDTFEGMPAEDYNGGEDSNNPPGKWAPIAPPADLFAGIENIKIMQGRFADTLPLMPADSKFLLVHLDCDYYNSYIQVLDWLKEGHLAEKAVLFVDDWDCEGCKRAVREWLARTPEAHFNGNDTIAWNVKTPA